MKKTLSITLIGLLTVISLAGKGTEPKKLREWTIIAYFDSNNDLDAGRPGRGVSYVLQELQQLEKVKWTPEQHDDVAVIALYASAKKGAIAKAYRIGWFGTIDTISDEELKSLDLQKLGNKDFLFGSVAMSEHTTLAKFINLCQYHFPAKHYALILMDHGLGWKGVCFDDRHGNGDGMHIENLAKALDPTRSPAKEIEGVPDSMPAPTKSGKIKPNAKNELALPVKIDVIFFAACLMSQVEVAYELAPYANYMVASEDLMWPQSTILPDWLELLLENPSMSSRELATQMMTSVYNAAENKDDTVTITLVDLYQRTRSGISVSRTNGW